MADLEERRFDAPDANGGRLKAVPPVPPSCVPLFLLLGLLLAACSGESTQSSSDAEQPGSTLASAAPDSSCGDQLGYPCSYDEVPQEIRETQSRIAAEIASSLDSGSTQDAADWVADQAGVVETVVTDTALVFRVDGGMPYMVAVPVGAPPSGFPDSLYAHRAGGTRVQNQHSPDQMLVSLGRSGILPDVVGRGTPRENPENRKRALFLEPWASDEGSLFGAGGRVDPEELLKAIPDYNHSEGVVHRTDEAVDVSWFMAATWNQYDYIYVSTHSSTWDGGATVETGIRREWDGTPDQEQSHCDEMLGPYVEFDGVKCGVQYTPDKSYVTVDLDLAFFVSQFQMAGNQVSKAIVYIEGCESMMWPTLAKAIIDDTSIYLGWSAGVSLTAARHTSGQLLVQLTKRARPVQTALGTLHAMGMAGGESYKDPENRSEAPWLIPHSQTGEADQLRLYDLPRLKDPKSPTNTLRDGDELQIEGIAGDENEDRLDITIDVFGVVDPEDTSPNPDDLLSVASGGESPAEKYRIQVLLGEDEVEIGKDNLGRPSDPGAISKPLNEDETLWSYSFTADLGLDIEEGGMDTKLKVIVTGPDELESEYEVEVTLVDAPVGATITVGGRVLEFELLNSAGFGYCIVVFDAEGMVGVRVAGFVDGDLEGVGFSASLNPDGGELTVDDPEANEVFMAAADRDRMTDLHLVPDGQSQIDDIVFEGSAISGTATFIDTKAFREYLHFDGAEPTPVSGSFEIRCPAEELEVD